MKKSELRQLIREEKANLNEAHGDFITWHVADSFTRYLIGNSNSGLNELKDLSGKFNTITTVDASNFDKEYKRIQTGIAKLLMSIVK